MVCPGVGAAECIAAIAGGGGVLTLVGVLILCCCAMFCCWKRRRNAARVQSANLLPLAVKSSRSQSPVPEEAVQMGNKSSKSPPSKQNTEENRVEDLKKADVNDAESPSAATIATNHQKILVGPEDTTAKGEPPVVKEYEKEVCVIEGQQATLRVEVTGVPQPSLTWHCQDKLVEPDYAIEIARDGALCFVSAEVSHTGTYQFTAKNSSGTVEGKIELKVKEEGEGGGEECEDASRKKTSVESEPVAVGGFGQYVASLHSNNNGGFFKQYQSLPSGEEGHSVLVFRTPANLPKNRFRNIAVYDDNRIVLQPLHVEQSPQEKDGDYDNIQQKEDRDNVKAYVGDYINASYIDGYSKSKLYIACQGPLPHTVVDFWRCVWQEGVGSIVMVTNLIEGCHVKCHPYWPTSGRTEYGPFSLTLAEQQMFADYIIRHLHISLGGKSRKVVHFQFTSWPDHGVPEYAGPSLTFLRRIKAETHGKKGPLLIHCSAGVGRTGTLLCVDIALEQAAKEGVVDIAHTVVKLRQQRMKMVQTHDQYTFIHDAVLEALICGETQIPAQLLPDTVKQLDTCDQQSGKTGYEVQFEVLNQVSPKPSEALTLTAQAFSEKNRSMNYLPSELWRVQLLTEYPGYINASFVNGYKQKQGYIIAQAPMDNTCRDFWKMVTDRKCGVIIMLSNLQENEKEVCTQYWPSEPQGEGGGGGDLEEGSEKSVVNYGEFTVELSRVQHGNLTRRTFNVVYSQSKLHKVTQFQLDAWDDAGLCTKPTALLELIEQVAAVQRRTGNNPIVVHGIDTVSRCGVFCTLSNAVHCCQTEGIVDVFQAVKALRIQKPGCLPALEQYKSIFPLMQQFLNSFSIYHNFK